MLRLLKRVARFRLATLLFVLTCFALCLGIWVTRSRRQQVAVQLLRDRGGCSVGYSNGSPAPDAPRTWSAFVAEKLGEDYVYKVTFVRFENDVTDGDLVPLSDLPHVEDLRVESSELTEDGFATIGRLRNLDYLTLNVKSAPVDAWATIGQLSKVTTLNLSGSALGDGEIASISSLPNLRHIYLNDTQVSNDVLRHLAKHSNLETVELIRTNITDESLVEVRKLEQLKHLFLQYTAISDEGLGHLAGHPTLEDISLTETDVTGSGIHHLQSLPRLIELNFRGCGLEPYALDELAKLTQLKVVCVSGERLTAELVAGLQAKRPRLSIVHASCPPLTYFRRQAVEVSRAGSAVE